MTHDDRVHVLDLDRRTVVGEITGLSGAKSVAVDAASGRGYVSNNTADSLTVFDLKTLAKIATIKTTVARPNTLLHEPITRRVFSLNNDGHNLTVLEADTGRIVGTVPLDGIPDSAACDGGGAIFVTIADKGDVVRVDAASLKITARWPLAPDGELTALGLDREHRRLLVGARTRSRLVVLDADNGRRVTDLPIGEGVDVISTDADRHLVFCVNNDATVSVARASGLDDYAIIATVATAARSKTGLFDPKTKTLFVSTADYGPAPAPTTAEPRPRGPILPGTFGLLVVEEK